MIFILNVEHIIWNIDGIIQIKVFFFDRFEFQDTKYSTK